MKKTNKKGFTLVELVIVIAVIAILAAVLIPVFANLISKANDSAAMQNAKNEFEAYLVSGEVAEHLTGEEDFYIKSGDNWYKVEDLKFNSTKLEDSDIPDNATLKTQTEFEALTDGQVYNVSVFDENDVIIYEVKTAKSN